MSEEPSGVETGAVLLRSAEKSRSATCRFADEVARVSIAAFRRLCPPDLLAQYATNQTVVSAIVVQWKTSKALEVLSVAAGTKVLAHDVLRLSRIHRPSHSTEDTAPGDTVDTVLRDMHAEVLARRGFVKYLFDLIDASQSCLNRFSRGERDADSCPSSSTSTSTSDDGNSSSEEAFQRLRAFFEVEVASDTGQWSLRWRRDKVGLHLYTSSAPCGNACLKQFAKKKNNNKNNKHNKNCNKKNKDKNKDSASSVFENPHWDAVTVPVARPRPSNMTTSSSSSSSSSSLAVEGGENKEKEENKENKEKEEEEEEKGEEEAVQWHEPVQFTHVAQGQVALQVKVSCRNQHSNDINNRNEAEKAEETKEEEMSTPLAPVCARRGASLSCSDKLLRWNCLGLQGGLLARYLHNTKEKDNDKDNDNEGRRLVLESVVIGRKFSEHHATRALCCRAAALRLPLSLPPLCPFPPLSTSLPLSTCSSASSSASSSAAAASDNTASVSCSSHTATASIASASSTVNATASASDASGPHTTSDCASATTSDTASSSNPTDNTASASSSFHTTTDCVSTSSITCASVSNTPYDTTSSTASSSVSVPVPVPVLSSISLSGSGSLSGPSLVATSSPSSPSPAAVAAGATEDRCNSTTTTTRTTVTTTKTTALTMSVHHPAVLGTSVKLCEGAVDVHTGAAFHEPRVFLAFASVSSASTSTYTASVSSSCASSASNDTVYASKAFVTEVVDSRTGRIATTTSTSTATSTTISTTTSTIEDAEDCATSMSSVCSAAMAHRVQRIDRHRFRNRHCLCRSPVDTRDTRDTKAAATEAELAETTVEAEASVETEANADKSRANYSLWKRRCSSCCCCLVTDTRPVCNCSCSCSSCWYYPAKQHLQQSLRHVFVASKGGAKHQTTDHHNEAAYWPAYKLV